MLLYYLSLSIYISITLSHTQAQQLCIFFYLQKGVAVKIFFISNYKKVLNMRLKKYHNSDDAIRDDDYNYDYDEKQK